MAYYLVAEIDVHDPHLWAEYDEKVGPTVEQFGGRYLVRGGEVRAGEGDWEPSRVVILEFPDKATMLTWANSDEYTPVAELRHRSSNSRTFGVEGV